MAARPTGREHNTLIHKNIQLMHVETHTYIMHMNTGVFQGLLLSLSSYISGIVLIDSYT